MADNFGPKESIDYGPSMGMKDPGPTESMAAQEPSLEDDLNLLERQIGELINHMQNLNMTRTRIHEKLDRNGIRASKGFETLSMVLRGEYDTPPVQAKW